MQRLKGWDLSEFSNEPRGENLYKGMVEVQLNSTNKYRKVVLRSLGTWRDPKHLLIEIWQSNRM